MAGRPRPQQFPFWMPYWSNPAPIPSRPAGMSRRQPLPRAPTADPPPSRRRRTRSSGLPAPPAFSAYSLQEENAGQRSSSSSPSPMQSLAQSRPVNKRSESPSPSSSTIRSAAPTTQASQQLEQVKTATSPSPQSASQPPQIVAPPQTQLQSNQVKEDHMGITQENSKANQDSEPDGSHSQLPQIEEEPGVNSQMNPVKTVDSDIIPEEQPDKDEGEENEEPQAQKTQNDTIKPKHSGPASHSKISSKAGEVNLGLNISRPENCEKNDGTSSGRPIRQNDSNGKGTKILISDIPRGSLFDGHRAAYHKEIEDGFSKLVSGVAEEPRRYGPAVNMITLAGENTGASMVIGDARNKEMLNSGCRNSPGMDASVNSNVQSINNSTLHSSSCSAGNPGVHVEITSKQAEPVIQMARTRIEPPKDKMRDANSHSDKRLPHEPRVRRRCLRALFMESESDPENPQKPRRHGCRFSCDEKRAKANQGGVSTSNPNHF